MASANHGNAGRRKSSVWDDFHRGSVSGAAGACAKATCNRCGATLQASAKKHGTSHLRRHANSSRCAKRAAQQQQPPPSVWDDFHRGSVSGAAGACAKATCNRCGATLQASAKKHGTSHLRRHANSSRCAKRAAQRDAKWADELLVEPEFIQGVDEPVDAGGHALAAGDDGRLSPSFIPDALPQAPSSSSTRFFHKKRERSANLASHEGETTGADDHSSRAKDWVPTVDDNFLLDMDFFTFEDWE